MGEFSVFSSRVSQSVRTKCILVGLTFGFLVLPTVALIAWGIPEEYVLPLMAVLILPFQYAASHLVRIKEVARIDKKSPEPRQAHIDQVQELEQVLQEISHVIPAALEMLNDRYHDLTVEAYGLPRRERRRQLPPENRLGSRQHVRRRALLQFSANVERLLREERTRQRRPNPLLEAAIDLVRGGLMAERILGGSRL